jgi:predicted choloylglycine hydrolase
MTQQLQFDAVSETSPGPKWKARWDRSWPAYKAWFAARGGDNGPSRSEAEAALKRHMPELVPVHARLTELAGGGDRAARFLAGWCPPAYLGGCSLMARAGQEGVRLVRNYDLSPDLNEGLMLHTGWTGRRVMGMVEFLWGLSDGINDAGLSVALAYGGGSVTGEGFGICLILRYVLETCDDVPAALTALRRIPSHMDYNLVLADTAGNTASVEMLAGGGVREMPQAIATNHQHGSVQPDRPAFTKTHERYTKLKTMGDTAPERLAGRFLEAPLFQTDHAKGFGTLFTAEYDPRDRAMVLHWPTQSWRQTIDGFTEGTRVISYDPQTAETQGWIAALVPWMGDAAEMLRDPATADWVAFGMACAQARPGQSANR